MSCVGSGARSFALLLTGVFVAIMLAVVAANTRTGGDEALYTDGALRMLASGDYLVPRTAEGALRFQKPPVTYWIIAGSWRLSGVNYFAARLPFALLMGAVLWMTFLLTRTLFRSNAAALASVAILAGNHNVFYAAERAVPDGPLTLFILMGYLGFARLLAAPASAAPRRRTGADRLLAWGGAGLAVATKGLLGVLLVTFSVACGRLRRSAGAPLAGPLSITVGVLLAGGWFAAVGIEHGSALLQTFIGDQLATRMNASEPLHLNLVRHLPKYVLTLATDFLPWLVLGVGLAASATGAARAFLREHRLACVFTLGWALLLVLIFSGANLTRPRYLLPAYPAIAAFVAAFLTALLRASSGARWPARLGRYGAGLAALCGLVVLAGGLRIDPAVSMAGAAITAATALCLYLGSRRPWPAPAAALGLWLLVLFAAYDGLVRSAFQATPAPTMAARLDAAGVDGNRVLAISLPAEVLSAVRVYSGATVWPRRAADAAPGTAAAAGAAAVLLTATERGAFEAAGWRTEPAGVDYGAFRRREIMALLRGGDRAQIRQALRRPYFIAFPPR